jgi:hypothetical protein
MALAKFVEITSSPAVWKLSLTPPIASPVKRKVKIKKGGKGVESSLNQAQYCPSISDYAYRSGFGSTH